MSRVLPITLNNPDTVRLILFWKMTTIRYLVKFLPGKNPNWTGYVKDGLMLYNGRNEPCCLKPSYMAGDILFVREAWFKDENRYMYRADYAAKERFYRNRKEVQIKWRPAILMPKEAANIWLKVQDVRLERYTKLENLPWVWVIKFEKCCKPEENIMEKMVTEEIQKLLD